MGVCEHGCDILDSPVFLGIIEGLGKFLKVMKILDYVSGLRNCLEFSRPSS